MAEENGTPKDEEFTWDEIAYYNMVQHEALINLLIKKEIISENEYLEQIQEVSKSLQERNQQE